MKHLTFKKLSILLVIVALLFVAACSNGNSNSNNNTAQEPAPVEEPATNNTNEAAEEEPAAEPEPEPEPRELVKLTIFGPPMIAGATTGIQDDPLAKEIEKRFGVQLDLVSLNGEGDPERKNVMLASGDLPDIFYANLGDMKTLIEGDMILPLDELVASHGPDLMKDVPHLVEFARTTDAYNNATGKLYAIPVQDGPSEKYFAHDNIAPMIRWDLYKDVGAPPITSRDQLLDVLKLIQEKHPTNENGEKMFAMSGWADWGNWWYTTFPSFEFNGVVTNVLWDIDSDNNILKHQFRDADSALFTSARFFNKAHRMGLVDPDSFSQKYDNFIDKVKNNRVIFNVAGWAGSRDATAAFKEAGTPEKGFVALPPIEGKRFVGFTSMFGNPSRNLTISKNSKHPDRAMEVINFLMSNEGNMMIYNGEKGKYWDDASGKPVPTEERYALSGAEIAQTTGIGKWATFAGRLGTVIHPEYGQPIDLMQTPEAFQKRLAESPIYQDYSKHYGVSYPGELIEKGVADGSIELVDLNLTTMQALQPVLEPNDEVSRIWGDINNYLTKNLPQLIMSKSEADFDKGVAKMQKDIIDMGLDTVDAYYKPAIEASKVKFDEVKVE